MNIELLIENYGLPAIFLGTAFEGETAAFLGGVIAHRDLLTYWAASMAASAGSFAGDQMWFFAGRYAAQWSFVRRRDGDAGARARVTQLLEKYPTGFIFAFRFLVGLRTISPIVIGTTHISTQKVPRAQLFWRRSSGASFSRHSAMPLGTGSTRYSVACRCIIIC